MKYQTVCFNFDCSSMHTVTCVPCFLSTLLVVLAMLMNSLR